MTHVPSDMSLQIPQGLSWLEQSEAGSAWLASLPDLLAASRMRFDLEEIGPPFSGGNVSYVAPARSTSVEACSPEGRQADRGQSAGADVVLKLQFIDRETGHEADALKAWNGNGAIRLLDHAPEIGALLLERCQPGRFLADDPHTDRLGALSGLLRKLLRPADGPFTSLQEEAGIWGHSMEQNWRMAGEPCEKYLVDTAIGALKDLSSDETDRVLLHQDLHGHNVLSAKREPWLVIDPKPLVGDPAFCLSPIVRSSELGHTKTAALHRLDRLSEELQLDRERARLWTIGQTMAWSFSSPWCERHFDTARWLLGH